MFAIVEAGGRQEKVQPGAVVVVDRLEAEPGAEITFDKVLLVENGRRRRSSRARPTCAGASVTGVVEAQTQGQEDRGLQDEAAQAATAGRRATARSRRACGSRASTSTDVDAGVRSWQQKKDKAVHATGATAIRSGSASSASTATSSPADRSSSASAAAGFKPGPERRPRQGRHAVRQGRRAGEVLRSRRARPRDQHPAARRS